MSSYLKGLDDADLGWTNQFWNEIRPDILRLWVLIAIATWIILPQHSAQAQIAASSPTSNENQGSQISVTALAQASPNPTSGQTTVFPVGLNVNRRNVFPSILVRGREDGVQAIDFSNWLLPYDAVIQSLKFTSKSLPNGQVELRSPNLVKQIDPTKLRTDPELGLVFSVQDLQDLFQVKAEFDLNEYAIQLQVPWLDLASNLGEPRETPVVLTGLPRINAPRTTLSAIAQRLNISNAATGLPQTTGDFTTIGTLLGGSWFVRTNQPDALQPSTWKIAEATFVRETDTQDYIVGSQPPFWLQQGLGENSYWGVTTIVRRGFKPATDFYGGTDVRRRLQSAQISRAIAGRAAPGTLVRLVQGLSDSPIAEVLVDSSGIYRFDNLQLSNQSLGGFYRILLYPQGQLTAAPEIRDTTFLNPQEQLPEGTSVLIASLGLNREFNGALDGNFFGNFSDVRGGLAQRWGLSQYLTVGLGGIYDESFRGLAELFFQPGQFPLRMGISTLSGDRNHPWEMVSDVWFEPSPTFRATFNSDRFSHRLNLNWQVSPSLGLFSSYDSENSIASGLQFSASGRGAFTYVRASLDTKNRLRWSISQYFPGVKFTQQGNEVGTLSALTYNFSRDSFQERGHSLLATYETQSLSAQTNDLLTLSWRYRSPQQASDGNYLWETQLGYGIGTQGAGLIASAGTIILPGLLVRGRYQEISATSDQPSFNLELVSSFNVQEGMIPGDRRLYYLRTLGGLSIQPFFDENQNGKRDANEAIYLEQPELLIILNNRPLKLLQTDISGDRILVRLPPGTVRLDIDPAGFPPDWQARGEAYAVDVVAGSYTPIQLPLIPAYTLAGVVVNAQGQPMSGVRVEAISAKTGERIFSVTNDAGVYYLERLQTGIYSLQINGKVAQPQEIKLDRSSQPLQELNLYIP